MKIKLHYLVIAFMMQSIIYAQTNTQKIASEDSEYVLNFDGVSENQSIKYTDDATSSLIDAATDYTIEMWVYPQDNMNSGDVLLSMTDIFRLTFYTNNRFYFTHKDPSASVVNTFYNVTDDALTMNQWNHIAVICNSTDGDNGSIKLYVNGTDVSADTYEAKALIGGSEDNHVYVGSFLGNATQFPSMMAREIRVKKEAVDPSTLNIDISDANYTTDANTAILFHFAEGTGLVTENEASGTNADLGFSDAHYPTWVTLSSTVVAVNEVNLVNFSIYPNPATRFVELQSTDAIESITVFDILGKMVYTKAFDHVSKTRLNTNTLNKGLYLLSVKTAKGSASKKLIIR